MVCHTHVRVTHTSGYSHITWGEVSSRERSRIGTRLREVSNLPNTIKMFCRATSLPSFHGQRTTIDNSRVKTPHRRLQSCILCFMKSLHLTVIYWSGNAKGIGNIKTHWCLQSPLPPHPCLGLLDAGRCISMLHTCRAFLPVCYKLGSHHKSALGTPKPPEHFNVSGKYAYVWPKQTQTMSQLSSLIIARKRQSPFPHPADTLLRNIANKKILNSLEQLISHSDHKKADSVYLDIYTKIRILGKLLFRRHMWGNIWMYVKDFKGKSIQKQIKVSGVHSSWRNIRYHTIGKTKTTENRKVNFQTLFTFTGTPCVTDRCMWQPMGFLLSRACLE